MELPKTTIEFKIKDNTYTAKYPNNGQFIDIETAKARMAGDTYGAIADSRMTSAQIARHTIDMIAFLTICGPAQLKKDLNVDSFSDLDMIYSKELFKVYLTIILPWLIEWEQVLNADEEVK